MNLTGKCLESFEKWFIETEGNDDFKTPKSSEGDELSIWRFTMLSPSMQYGVYVDFFDSVGIDIEDHIERSLTGKKMYYACRISKYKRDSHLRELLGVGRSKQRHEARTAAINKAVEIFNERH